MNPAVRVEQIARYVVTTDAIDRVTEVLTSGHHQREGDQNQKGELVMQTKYMIVDRARLWLDERLQIAEQLIHGGRIARALGTSQQLEQRKPDESLPINRWCLCNGFAVRLLSNDDNRDEP